MYVCCVTHGGRCCSGGWRRSGCEPERKEWVSSSAPRYGSPTGSDASCGLTQEGAVSIGTCGQHTAGHSTKGRSKRSANRLAVTSSNEEPDQSERLLLEVEFSSPSLSDTDSDVLIWTPARHTESTILWILWLLYFFTHTFTHFICLSAHCNFKGL